MNKSELVDALASATGMSKTDAGKAIDAIFGTDDGIIASALKKGDRVQITGFGTFETKSRKARTGRNPAPERPSRSRPPRPRASAPGRV
jgi:DNA-binding protein HU-beta